MASTFLSKTLGTSTNTYKGTVSIWFKKCQKSSDQVIYGNYTSGTQRAKIVIAGDGELLYYQNDSGSVTIKLETTRRFLDYNAWYHLVLSVDTTQASSSDRVKMYINGVQETVFDTATYPSQNTVFYLNANSVTNYIGQEGNSSDYWDGLMTHVHVIDGTAYAPSDFGETDSTSGIWVAKSSPSVTYGSNGFFLKFENSGAMGTDSSGNGNNFTVSGSMTQNKDTPDNNFAIFNSSDVPEVGEKPTLTLGNLQGVSTNSGHINGISSLAVETGKWYAEFKCTARSGATDDFIGCIASPAADLGSTNLNDPQTNNKSYGIRGDGSKYEAGTGASFAGSYAINDIIGVGIDATNNRLYFSKNGQWQNGTSWDSASPNSYITLPSGNTWHFLCGDTANSQNYTWVANFGSGYFGTTQVSSSNADANGHGLMEYAPPSGYYTLNTKNIKEFG